MAEAGYTAYEISNFAQDGEACKHNRGYWLYDDYIGIGAGAAGKWDTSNGGVLRYSNIRSPSTYIEAALQHGLAVNSDEDLRADQAMGEAVWLGLRQNQGIDLNWFKLRFDQPLLEAYPVLVQQWQSQGHLEVVAQHLRLTSTGLSLADDISASFLF